MPKMLAIRHTWTVTVQREEADTWPDLRDQLAKTFMLTPARILLTYARIGSRWSFEAMQVHGTRYRPGKAGSKDGRGTGVNIYRAGNTPPGFDDLIREQRYHAGLDPLSPPDWQKQATR